MKTKSLCPECLSLIEAEVYEKEGRILIKKDCPLHGYFEDVYWSDAELYEKFKRYEHVGAGFEMRDVEKGCPYDCGLCPEHRTTTLLANIDLTNRCNQNCPTCFANASPPQLYEPSMDELERMMRYLRSEIPPCPAVQFSGGEPTMREDFFRIIAMAREIGFPQIQVATNGILLSRSEDFCRKMMEAGLHTVYLQFDGTKEEAYEKLRGRKVMKVKLKAIENCRKGGIKSVVLVPTLAKNVNDDQIGDMIRFASKERDIIRGINVQPISFTGRIDKEELRERRITIPDFIKLVEEQTDGEIPKESFYPVPTVVPISRFVEAWKGTPQVEFTVHPHCGAATYVFVSDGKLIPITEFVDVDGLIELINESIEEIKKERITRLKRMFVFLEILRKMKEFVDFEKAPEGVNPTKSIFRVISKGSRESTASFHRNTIFIGVMHFMDPYNFDIQRVKRCGIHYITPDLRVIPFCTYNTIHRESVERMFSRDNEQRWSPEG